MKFLSTLFLLLIHTFVYSQNFTTSDEVIQKYLEVTKIKSEVSKIKDLTLNYTSESQRGVAETEFKYMFPLKFSMIVFANGMEIMSQKFDGEILVRKSNFNAQASSSKSGVDALTEANRSHPFLEAEYESLHLKAQFIGKENSDNKAYYVIEMQDNVNTNWKDYYNCETGFKEKTILKIETPKGTVESTVLFDNYKAFKGSEILFPANKKQIGRMGEIVSELQSIKVNKGLKPSDFTSN